MQLDGDQHPENEVLEQYAAGSLDEPALGELEEHLLVCTQCQGRLEEMDVYVAAMRGAAAQLEHDEESHRRFWTRVSGALTFRRLGWAMAAAGVLLIGVAVYIAREPAGAGQPLAIALETTRGSEIQHAPADKPLELSLNITGLASFPEYGVEIVDAAGGRLADMRAASKDNNVQTSVRNGLEPGTYFIRVHSPSGDLLREYGLQVDARNR
ncbi:MAG TPA: hypothetical protein VJN43_03890 [Bryobacteraceae bacterium]|nr:hypothetical protein [Bryobacteraceae bacterium]